MTINITEIKDRVREFYATGVKSNNKVYVKSSAEMISFKDFDELQKGFFNRLMSSSKFNERNDNRVVSSQHRFEWKTNSTPGTFYDYGREIWNSSVAQEFRSGNCAEMAWVSAYLLVAEYHVDPKNVFFGMINQPGDHGFCLLVVTGAPSGTWTKVSDMTAGSHGNSLCFVIDPWLNVTCEACSYSDLVRKKLEKWHSDGKRVAWKGPNANALGWSDPGSDYGKTFQSAPLEFRPII